MTSYWILKTEPGAYSYTDLEREGRTVWDGVANNAALKHMRSMAEGDQAVIYHTGDERAAVGTATLASGPYADPHGGEARLVVVDVRPGRRLARPVGLAALKAEPTFAGSPLLREARLSVVPLSAAQWQRILELADHSAEDQR